jgi:hypothetical protein
VTSSTADRGRETVFPESGGRGTSPPAHALAGNAIFSRDAGYLYVKGVAEVFHRGGGQGGHVTNAWVHPRDSLHSNFENIILDVADRAHLTRFGD